MMPREQDLGGFTGEQPEWSDIANRIAREECGDRACKRKSRPRREAPAPAFRSNQEPQSGEGEDDDEAPADAPDAVEDVSDAGAPDRVGEQRRACQSGNCRDDVLAAHGLNPTTQIPKPKPRRPRSWDLELGIWDLGFSH